MDSRDKSTDRTGSAYTFLSGEQGLASSVLRALWFQLFDPDHIEFAYESKPETLRCITTLDGFRQALHDYFAFVCTGRSVDPVERAVALHFSQDQVIDVAPAWASESQSEEVLRAGIGNYTPGNPVDDSWMDEAPEEERAWFDVCAFVELLTEYDDLSMAEAARQKMLEAGIPREQIDASLREVVAPLARISDRDLEILGVEGCHIPIDIPDDWSQPEEVSDDRLHHDLQELVCRVHDEHGQPVVQATSFGMCGRYVEIQIDASFPAGRGARSRVSAFRLADDSCAVRLATVEQSRFIRTAPATWGCLGPLDKLATVWAELLGVQPSPYCEVVDEDDNPH